MLSNDPVVKTYWALTSNPPPRGARSGWIEAPLTEVGDGDGYATARLVGGWRVYDAKGGGVVVGAGESMRDKVQRRRVVLGFTRVQGGDDPLQGARRRRARTARRS